MSDKVTILEEELQRKDEIIKKLKKENEVLMRLSLKGAQEKIDLKHKIHEMHSQK